MKNVLLISGSLRAGSMNTGLLKSFAEHLPSDVTTTWADINLPLFNEELEAEFPSSAQTLRDQVLAADTIIIATPEYNRGMSGALKNAIDWASRPYGQNAWKGKRVLVCGVSVGSISAALAVYQVKQSFLHLDAHVLGQPEFMVGNGSEKFTPEGVLHDEGTKAFVVSAIDVLKA
jgi:chromate reductase